MIKDYGLNRVRKVLTMEKPLKSKIRLHQAKKTKSIDLWSVSELCSRLMFSHFRNPPLETFHHQIPQERLLCQSCRASWSHRETSGSVALFIVMMMVMTMMTMIVMTIVMIDGDDDGDDDGDGYDISVSDIRIMVCEERTFYHIFFFSGRAS